MGYYPARVCQRLTSPCCSGRVSGANGVGTSASFSCGCFVRISIAVDLETKVVLKAGFQTNGCGFMVAVADLAAERLSDACLTDLHSMDEVEFIEFCETGLGPFPAGRSQCARVVLEAAKAALADHRAFVLEEFAGEKALICTCFGVSEDTIESLVSTGLASTVDDVTRACRAGGGCGSCRMLIQEILDQRDRED